MKKKLLALCVICSAVLAMGCSSTQTSTNNAPPKEETKTENQNEVSSKDITFDYKGFTFTLPGYCTAPKEDELTNQRIQLDPIEGEYDRNFRIIFYRPSSAQTAEDFADYKRNMVQSIKKPENGENIEAEDVEIGEVKAVLVSGDIAAETEEKLPAAMLILWNPKSRQIITVNIVQTKESKDCIEDFKKCMLETKQIEN